ncbi:MAG: triose-phosphate isomerase [archaeon]|nr:triose-phosphate isomerase [archaeon]
MKPLIILNFKVYEESSGRRGVNLARKLSSIRTKGYDVILAPTLPTLSEISHKVKLPVFSQHADPVGLGAHTGQVSVDELKKIGVRGVILNHSERKIPFSTLKKTVELCKKNRLVTVICASSLSEIRKVAHLQPQYVCYEPKELIGGKVSVTEARPNIIVKAVDIVRQASPRTLVLCGAGIHSKADLGLALMLGAHGVMIGHAVPKAANPKKFLQEMLL